MDILQSDFLKKQHILAHIQEESDYLEGLCHKRKEELKKIENLVKEVNFACLNIDIISPGLYRFNIFLILYVTR